MHMAREHLPASIGAPRHAAPGLHSQGRDGRRSGMGADHDEAMPSEPEARRRQPGHGRRISPRTGGIRWPHSGVSACTFAVFTPQIARLRVRDTRATVGGRALGARHSNETRAVRLPGPRHPSRSNRPARLEPRGVRHRWGTKSDAGSRLPLGNPEPTGRSAAAARARQY